MERLKENVFKDHLDMVKNSWTYARLTSKEKERLEELYYDNCVRKSVKGNYEQRYETLNTLYRAFLSGVGYTSYTNCSWREETNDNFLD